MVHDMNISGCTYKFKSDVLEQGNSPGCGSLEYLDFTIFVLLLSPQLTWIRIWTQSRRTTWRLWFRPRESWSSVSTCASLASWWRPASTFWHQHPRGRSWRCDEEKTSVDIYWDIYLQYQEVPWFEKKKSNHHFWLVLVLRSCLYLSKPVSRFLLENNSYFAL